MDKIQKGACAKYHANHPPSYFDSITFWQTPTQDCGNGQSNCTDYSGSQQKWTQIKR
jgi:putative spermidine/putrescine transport system substrate-binding protein